MNNQVLKSPEFEESINEDLTTEIFDEKQGYEYLNSLFFLRYRKIMISPIKMRIAIIGIVFIIGMFLVQLFPNKGVISYFCIRIKTFSYYFTLGVQVISILYMAVELTLTYNFYI